MKKLVFVIISAFLIQFSYGQDTLKHITSKCISHVISSKADSISEGIHFRYSNDTLEIYGTIWANCCGVHFVKIIRANDTIVITSFDTGQLCNCVCMYYFDIKIPASVNDSIVKINDVLYNTRKTNSIKSVNGFDELIELYPNPTDNILTLKVLSGIRIEKITITDISGRKLKYFDNTNPVIDLNEFESGIYFLKLELDNQQSIVKRIMKK